MRTALGVLVICAIAAAGVYTFERPTLGSGELFAAQFVADHPTIKEMTCDERYEIGVEGAAFHCAVVMKDGDSERVAVKLDRAGMYRLTPIQSVHPEHAHLPASADPWE